MEKRRGSKNTPKSIQIYWMILIFIFVSIMFVTWKLFQEDEFIKEREVTVETVSVEDGVTTIMTRDGIVIHTDEVKGKISKGKTVVVGIYRDRITDEISYKLVGE